MGFALDSDKNSSFFKEEGLSKHTCIYINIYIQKPHISQAGFALDSDKKTAHFLKETRTVSRRTFPLQGKYYTSVYMYVRKYTS